MSGKQNLIHRLVAAFSVAALGAGAGAIGMAGAAYLTAAPRHVAMATLAIDPPGDAPQGGRAYLHTQAQIIASERLLSEAADALRLQGDTADQGLALLSGTTRAEVHPQANVVTLFATASTELEAETIADVIAQVYIADHQSQKRDALDTRIAWISARVAALEAELTLTETRAVPQSDAKALRGLQFQQGSLRLMHQKLLEDLNTAEMERDLLPRQSRLLSGAKAVAVDRLPDARVWAFGALTGGLLSLLLAALRHRSRQLVRSPQDLLRLEDLQVLGSLPRLSGREATRLSSLLRADPGSPFGEAVRAVRTALLLQTAPEIPRLIAITSASAGAGRVGLTIALAENLAGFGKRVLVVDADLRSARIGRVLRARPPVEGLAAVLRQPERLHELAQRDLGVGFDVILPERHTRPDSDLFASAMAREALHSFAASYDFVLVHAPPVLSTADSALVLPICETAILSAAASRTSVVALREALAFLSAIDVPVAGAILTGAPPDSTGDTFHSVFARQKTA